MVADQAANNKKAFLKLMECKEPNGPIDEVIEITTYLLVVVAASRLATY